MTNHLSEEFDALELQAWEAARKLQIWLKFNKPSLSKKQVMKFEEMLLDIGEQLKWTTQENEVGIFLANPHEVTLSGTLKRSEVRNVKKNYR